MNGLLDAHQEIEAADRRKAAEAMRLAFWAEAGAFDQAMERMGGAPAPDDGTGSITNL